MTALEHLLISDLEPGTVLADRYTIRAKLGDGAVASVYLAADVELGREVALKVLDPLRSVDPVARARFERELEVLSRISHDGVARCYGAFNTGELDVLVLEHVEGETLAARIARERLPVLEACAIALAIARALEACHAEDVLHRDLKPENIILHPGRGPVILDFGAAWFSSAATLTRTGSVIGSPQYIAPEVFKSGASDARADLYALGVILFEMLTGRSVYLADSLAEMAAAHLDLDPPRVSTLRPGVGRELDRIVARAVAPRAADRFATAGELAQALETRTFAAGRPLQARLPCSACRTPMIIDLPICPGCGREVAWALEPGPYAVQLDDVPEPATCAAWLATRHGATRAVSMRLHHVPVPLAVGTSRASAEQLLSEAEELGCRGEVIRARAILGAKLTPAAATPAEIASTAALHFVATVLAVIVLAFGAGAPLELQFAMPPVVAMLGMAVAAVYVRRPVLRVSAGRRRRGDARAIAAVRAPLATLKTERARLLAAGAVSRAAPVLLHDTSGLSADAAREVLEALGRALASAKDLDTHAELLQARPRAALGAAMEEARASVERGDDGASVRLAALEQERRELTAAAIAHDLAARRVLEACQNITDVLATRAQAAAAIRELA